MRASVRIIGLLLLAASSLAVAEDTKVSVATKKGDLVDGTLVGVSATDVSILIAGQSVKIPLADVKYLSFSGRLDTPCASGASGGARPGSAEDAFAALDDLRGALQVGVLRPQYSDKTVALLPRVNAFARDIGTGEWMDVRIALAAAVSEYSIPLVSLEAWEQAPYRWARASRFVDYAKKLYSNPGERTHGETENIEGMLDLGKAIEMRLGVGDAKLPQLDSDWGGRSAERYKFSIATPAKVIFTGTGAGYDHALFLMDTNGNRIGKETGESTSLKKKLQPGTYLLWVSSMFGDVKVQSDVEAK
jgi:hypothetical protein